MIKKNEDFNKAHIFKKNIIKVIFTKNNNLKSYN